jgi:hypothetical protein
MIPLVDQQRSMTENLQYVARKLPAQIIVLVNEMLSTQVGPGS